MYSADLSINKFLIMKEGGKHAIMHQEHLLVMHE